MNKMKLFGVHLFCILLLAVFTFGFLYLPMQDYPNLMYQGFVFNEYFFHSNTFGGFFHIYPYIPPNVVSTVILGFMNIMLDPFLSGKIYIFLLGLGLYSGLFRYQSFHLNEKKAVFAVVALFLTFNLHFLMGYLNFLTGLAIVLHTIVFIRRRRYEGNFIVLGLSILLIYFCHFAALAIFFMYFLTYLIIQKNYRSLLCLNISGIPMLIVFIQYLAVRTIPTINHTQDTRTVFYILKMKLLIFFATVIPFHDFKWVHDLPIILKMIDYLFCAIVLVLFLYIIGKNILTKNFSLELALASISFLLIFFLPFYFGGVLLPGERFVVFCFLNIFILLYREKIHQSVRNVVFACGSTLILSTYVYLLWNAAAFNAMIENNVIPQEALLHPELKQEGINGFTHIHFYQNIKLKTASPFFNTGLFSYPDSNKIDSLISK